MAEVRTNPEEQDARIQEIEQLGVAKTEPLLWER